MYFYVEATWKPDESGQRLNVDLEFHQLFRTAEDAPISLTDLLDGAFQPARRLIGAERVTDQAMITPLRVRKAALRWLAEHAGMTGADSLEFRVATHADIEFLDRLAALTTA